MLLKTQLWFIPHSLQRQKIRKMRKESHHWARRDFAHKTSNCTLEQIQKGAIR